MEMESAESDLVGNSLKETPIEDLIHSDTPTSNVFGDQHVLPRVGGKYQVEIPFMTVETMESERLKLLTNPADSEIASESHSFLMGLPIPIAWVKEGDNIEAEGLDSPTTPDDAVNVKKSLEARKRKKIHKKARKKNSELNADHLESGLGQGGDSRSTSLKTLLLKERQSYQLLESKSCSPVPDSSREPWSDTEADSFLLGLYIFGKNFIQVKRFMEHKSTGEIMSFYYGIFYRSDEYYRWSDCQKGRKKKCIIGEKIFTGWRQRELCSRMIPHVQEESRITLFEGYRSFAEGRTLLEEYVSSLKSTVGIPVLVEAVGIGKGEEDLTGFPIEPGKNNQETPGCSTPRVPNGKAFASLSFTEIVKLLTGGVRLSKARCTDIFWEAVWPRLLANGWHSEQPKDRGYVSSENYLVFLMPGIKKYSKRKLTKGDHFLDSVSDVLNKVASEPKLIQLEAEKDPVGNEVGGWTPEVTSDQEDESCFQRPCYLKPRVSKSNSNHLKFTVVDTSLAHGGKSRGIVELMNLPGEVKTNTEQSNSSSDSEGESSEYKLVLNEYQNGITQRGEMPLKKNKAKNGGGGSDLKRFTVVDTSLVFGGKSSTVREIRCLPAVDKCVLKSKCTSWETEAVSSEDLLQKVKPDATDISQNAEVNNSNIDCHEDTFATTEKVESHQDQKTSMSDDKQPKGSTFATTEKVESHQDQKTSMSDDKQPKGSTFSKFSRRAKPSHSDSIGPLIKRRKLTACVKAETSSLIENCSEGLESEQVEQVGLHGTLTDLNSGTLVVALVGPKQKESSSTSEAEGNLEEESSLEARSGDCSGMQTSQTHTSSDQSQPQDLVDRMGGDICFGFSHETNADISGLSSSGTKTVDDSLGTNMNSRRQSTRTRPLTTKAMEALANGYLSIKTRQKKVVGMRENSLSRPSRKSHRLRSIGEATSSPPETVGGTVTPKEEMEVNEACNATEDTVRKPLDQMADKWLTSY
ncbi:PREDICTED: uncharacterized protein LOC101290777 isoform X2 [Fragaria vesca subsp. vesca]|uniref:uncharacterized protein LOC101290777 isoform X2 n=1 Tax=Fragaria vesca subsp. vesca TaxID=101020 RepID=UPI0002C31717|nr:PREDICTED: uncharacterized protein LOC101290777 isoform X2 [Fragaria vesca subsp. vesca]